MRNRQPMYYMQTDERWGEVSYSVSGESTTIGASGCGPTCAAMLISTITGTAVTPLDTCTWSLKHGYKALKQGTYYSYFVPQFAEYGIDCKRLNTSRIINQPDNPVHDEALRFLHEGYYLIALMGPGTWTKSGHYVVVWGIGDEYYINDPASTKIKRLRGDIATFRNECRMYWAIDARSINEEDDDMDLEAFKRLYGEMRKELKDNDANSYSSDARNWAIKTGLIAGNGTEVNGQPNYMWEDLLTREQFITVLYRFAKIMGKV